MSWRRKTLVTFLTVGGGNWNKPAGARLIFVSGISAGQGGGGGGLVATAVTGLLAGLGGLGGSFSQMLFPAAAVPNVVPYNVAAGGPGSLGAVVNGVSPLAGNVATETFFGDLMAFSARTSIAVAPKAKNMYDPQASSTGIGMDGGIAGGNGFGGAAGGGSGGGFTVTTGAIIASLKGGDVGANHGPISGGIYAGLILGGLPVVGGNGNNGGTPGANSIIGGGGGAGGASIAGAGAAGNGGDGGFPGGGGGCGGGGVNGTSTAGKGGKGGDALICVVVIF